MTNLFSLPCLSCHCLVLFALVVAAMSQQVVDKYGNDFAFQGENQQRQIWRCNKDQPNGYAAQLKSLLIELDQDLPTLQSEANRGTDSPYGFATWFKTNDNIQTVTGVLAKVQESAELDVTVNIFPGTPIAIPKLPLTFVCINDDDPVFKAYYDWCQQGQQGLNRAGLAIWGTALIIICPSYWNLPRLPPSTQCPRVDTKGKFWVSSGLGWNQYGFLLHEMIEKYIHTTGQGLGEVYLAKEMIALSPEKTVDNPSSYQTYACCEYIRFDLHRVER